MNKTGSDIRSVLEVCIVATDDVDSRPYAAAWERLVELCTPTFQKMSHRIYDREHRQEFCDWWSAWLVAPAKATPKAKVRALYNRLIVEIEAGHIASEADTEAFFNRYLPSIVQSAIRDFAEEHRYLVQSVSAEASDAPLGSDTQDVKPAKKKRRRTAPSASKDDPIGDGGLTLEDLKFVEKKTPLSLLANQEQEQRLADVVHSLPAEYRVPFTLKAIAGTRLFDLVFTKDDLAWTAQQAGLSAKETDKRIDQEIDRNNHKDQPLDATFIASLLGISVDSVYQRASRALAKLQSQSRATKGGDL